MITPLADRLVVLPRQADTVTKSGLIIPDIAKEKQQIGRVIAVGPGTSEETMYVSVDQEVLYGKYSGTPFELDGVDYLIIRQSDILAILTD